MFTKKGLLGPMAGVMLALAASQANAGDGYGEQRPPAPAWQGFYVGVAAGYSIGTSEFSFGPGNVFPLNIRGAQGVLTIGYDFQLSPRWVAGLFADYAFGEVDGGQAALPIMIDNQWAVGARLGVLATPSTLLYMSGGYTAADLGVSLNSVSLGDTTLDGYFVGLGVEQVLGRNLSLKLDYRFSDYEDEKRIIPGIATATLENTMHSVRLGVNWRFAETRGAASAVDSNDRFDALRAPAWNGPYLGAAAGYGIASSDGSQPGADISALSLRGVQGIIAVGYDFRLSPRWVTGLFADYAFGELDGRAPGNLLTLDNQWAIGGRLGVLATPSTLLFASAGYTAADFKFSGGSIVFADTTLGGSFLGLGVEQAIGRNLSLQLDYRYSDYQDVKGTIGGLPFTFDNTLHSVRLGVNWRLH